MQATNECRDHRRVGRKLQSDIGQVMVRNLRTNRTNVYSTDGLVLHGHEVYIRSSPQVVVHIRIEQRRMEVLVKELWPIRWLPRLGSRQERLDAPHILVNL